MASEQQTIDPYRVFFPIGCAFAFWGAAVWLAFDRQLIAYPGQLHADLMIGGFLLAFSTGFLLTAVPKFTGTAHALRRELWIAGVPMALQVIAATGLVGERWRSGFNHLAMALGLAVLVALLGPRYFRRTQEPPPTFVIAGLGLLAGLVGALLLAVTELAAVPSSAATLGRLLLLHGFMPALVMGIGGRLFPALLGRAPSPLQTLGTRPTRARGTVIVAVVFLAGIAVEVFASSLIGRLLSASAVIFVALRDWQLHKRPRRRGVQPWLLWLAAWSFVAGFWGYALFPAYGIHALHLTFVAGLGLTTFTVATRVVLSHGGFDLAAELSSRALLGAGILMLLSMGARVFAGVAPFAYFHELAWAALLWLAALVVWSARFLPAVRTIRS